MKWIIILSITFLFNTALPLPVKAEQAASEGSELNLPWQAFRDLLKLDQDEISLTWDEFQRLIKQTGVTETPQFQMKNGNVVLSRAEFKNLLDRMKTPPAEAPKYFLTKAVYKGRVSEGSTQMKGELLLQVLSQEKTMSPLRIPLFPGNMAFKEVLLNGKQALIENDGSRLYITVTKPGDHVISTVFSVPSSLKKEPHNVSFNIPSTPITQLQLTLPIRNLDVQVSNAAQVDTQNREGGTLVKASLPTQTSIYVHWNPVAPSKSKGPSKVYAEIFNLISIEEDALRVTAQVHLDVLQNTINVLNVKVPEGYSVLEVKGEGVGDWKKEEDSAVITIPFRYARKGKFNLTILAENVLTEKNSVVGFDGFHVLKTVREKGFVGVELKTSAEAQAIDLKGLDRLDTRELPQPLQNLSRRPLIFGFRYLRQPYELNLDIQRHEDVAVISTVVDEASGVSLVLKDGKRVDNITYKVRNTWKQFLEINLPQQAQVWSVFVDGERRKPSRKKDGKILIPLNRSKSVGNNLESFDVEVMYYLGSDNLSPAGFESMSFPIPDVVVSQMLWSVYLPTDFDYLYFGGNVDKEVGATGVKPLMAALKGGQQVFHDIRKNIGNELYRSDAPATEEQKQRRIQQAKDSELWRQRGSFKKAQGITSDFYARQVERELNFFNKLSEESANQAPPTTGEVGVLPIRIHIPPTGKVFRFTKQIVVEQKPVDLNVTYISKWLVKLIKVVVLVGLLLIVIRLRKRVMAGVQHIQQIIQDNREKINMALSPAGLIGTCFVLFILFSFVSRLLTVVSLFALVGAMVRWAWVKIKDKRKLA